LGEETERCNAEIARGGKKNNSEQQRQQQQEDGSQKEKAPIPVRIIRGAS
jgi:hypothetical protein